MPESPNPGQSYEAWIESKAGASPCPKCGSTDNWHTGHGFDIADLAVDTGFTIFDVPVKPSDPNCSTFTGRKVYRTDVEVSS